MHEENSFDSIDSMAEETNRLVEFLYRDRRSPRPVSNAAHWSTPRRIPFDATPLANTASSTERIKTPERKKGNAAKSPTSREVEIEVDRINRFCDSVDRNLAAFNRSMRQQNRGLRSRSSLNGVVESVPRMRAPRATREPEAIIDLSDYSPLPQLRRQNFNTNDIVVLDDVVDLCSPINNLTNGRPIGHRNASSADVSLQRRIEQSCTTSQHYSSKNTNESPLKQKGNASPNRLPKLTCPVCMESSVTRKPTTTKCGHIFCSSCISEAIRITHKCPICNTKLTKRMIFRIYV